MPRWVGKPQRARMAWLAKEVQETERWRHGSLASIRESGNRPEKVVGATMRKHHDWLKEGRVPWKGYMSIHHSLLSFQRDMMGWLGE